MNALFKLQFLQMKGTFRRLLRGAKTVRGGFLLALMIGLTLLGIAPSLLTTLTTRDQPEFAALASMVESFLPGILLVFWLVLLFTSAGEFSVFFTPAEVDFLFPAPFHRRQLLAYKLSKTAISLAMMSMFLMIYFLPVLRSWWSGVVGTFLTLSFMNLAGMAITLAGQIVSVYSASRTRKTILTVVTILAGLALAQMVVNGVSGRPPQELAEAFRSSFAGKILLAPFEVFSHTICSAGIRGGLLEWGAASLAIDAAILLLVFRLDADYLESASTISGRVYERAMRAKQGGGIAIEASSRSVRFHPGRFPWLCGTGPIAWRQVILTFRRSRLQFLTSLILASIFFIICWPKASASGAVTNTLALISGLIYLSALLTMQAPWAFRGDLDHIEHLKTLPIRPGWLVLGQLAGGVSMLTAIQASILVASLILLPVSIPMILACLAFITPLNTTVLAVNNLLFLLYPFRTSAGTSMDVQEVGRALVFTLLQGLILIPALGIPAGIGLIAYLAGATPWAGVALAWGALVVEIPLLLWMTGRAFDQFDPGTQTPA